MGTVYKGFQKSMARDVAIKVLHPETSRRRDYVERFFREAKLAAKVKHTNIIAAYDVGEHKGFFYLVMEYFPGRTLKTILFEEDRIDLATALDLGLQIARALENAHTNGLVHRDIKPENVLINEEGVAKLCDMGLAKELRSDLEEEGEVAGTPLYISPEMAAGSKDVDIRSDIYSLGATLHHMILGRPAFLGTRPRRIIRMHIEDPLVPPAKRDSTIPKDVSDLIVKMMAKEPASRHTDPAELVLHLERVRGSLAAAKREAAPEAAPEEPAEEDAPAKKVKHKKRKKGEKSLAPLWIAIVVAVLLMGGIAFLIGGSGEPGEEGSRSSSPSTSSGPKEDDRGSGGGAGDTGESKTPSESPKEKDPAEGAFRKAEAHLDTNPADLLGAAAMYRKAAEIGKDSPLGREARKRADALVKKNAALGEQALEKAQSEAAAFEEAGRLGAAIDVLQGFLAAGDRGEAAKKKVDAEIDRLGINLLSRWTVDLGAIEDLRKQGAFDEAVRILMEVVDPEKGYATKETLLSFAEVDSDALLVAMGREKAQWKARIEHEAGPKFASLDSEWVTLLATGIREEAPGEPPLSLFKRFQVVDRKCSEALADPALAPVAERIRSWRNDLAHLMALGERRAEGFRVLAERKARVLLAGQDIPSRVMGVTDRGGKAFVRFAAPPAMIPLFESLEKLGQEGIVAVLEAASEAGGSTAGHHLALGMVIMWSTPGQVRNAASRAKEAFDAAAAGGLDVTRYLAVLEERRGALESADLRRSIRDALRLAAASDKKKQAAALEALKALAKAHGDTEAYQAKKKEIEAAITRLRRKLGPSEEVKIPFLNGETLSYDPKKGRFEIRYKFSKPQEMTDWEPRIHGTKPDPWWQLVLDKHIGREPKALLQGGKVNFSGGGYLVWRPRLEGDMTVELDFTAPASVNYFFLFCSSDAGSYAFHPVVDMQGLSDFARTAGMDVPSGADTGLSVVNLAWSPKIQPLKDDATFLLRPKCWHRLRLARKGDTITAGLYDRRSNLVKEFSTPEETYAKGRFALAVLKSGVIIDNVLITGAFEEAWFKAVKEGKEEGERGDMPGERAP
jgi:serine/threonine-protein kinase